MRMDNRNFLQIWGFGDLYFVILRRYREGSGVQNSNGYLIIFQSFFRVQGQGYGYGSRMKQRREED